jgi:hypothetical protein
LGFDRGRAALSNSIAGGNRKRRRRGRAALDRILKTLESGEDEISRDHFGESAKRGLAAVYTP